MLNCVCWDMSLCFLFCIFPIDCSDIYCCLENVRKRHQHRHVLFWETVRVCWISIRTTNVRFSTRRNFQNRNEVGIQCLLSLHILDTAWEGCFRCYLQWLPWNLRQDVKSELKKSNLKWMVSFRHKKAYISRWCAWLVKGMELVY